MKYKLTEETKTAYGITELRFILSLPIRGIQEKQKAIIITYMRILQIGA